MTYPQFTAALVRLSKHDIGSREAATLFCIGAGATYLDVAKAQNIHGDLAKARIRVLRNKRLVIPEFREGQAAIYRPTKAGERVIIDTYKFKTKEESK